MCLEICARGSRWGAGGGLFEYDEILRDSPDRAMLGCIARLSSLRHAGELCDDSES